MKHIHEQVKAWVKENPEAEAYRFDMHWMLKGLEQGLEKHNMHLPKIDDMALAYLYNAAVAVHCNVHRLRPDLKIVASDGERIEESA